MAEVLDPIQIHTRPVLDLSDDDRFFQFCQINNELRIERTADGDIIVMTPEGGGSGRGNSKLVTIFTNWAEADGTGEVFGSSTGFTLPNGAMRSPDVAWVLKTRLQKLRPSDWRKFLPLCPDFVLELRSPSDRLSWLQDKMDEYIANGARLGWLIDPDSKCVHIYKPKARPKILNNPRELSGDPVLPGFKLELPSLWAAMRVD
jgi:Uma2 family endonuclease